MRGAVAAGHTLTAEAGAEVLREGGNAVDACIAAACMSWVTESTLTSPGGGGFLLVRESSTGRVRLHDFFISIPGQGLARPPGEMEAVDVEFDRGASQIFRIGAASCGVPGAIAGLEAAHRDYATLPWRRLLEPAIAVAREGHELTKPQAFLHAILDVILRRTETGREIYGAEGVRLVAGDRPVMPGLGSSGADRDRRGRSTRAGRRSRDDAHLGRRRRRQCRLADRLERLRRGRNRAWHRHPPQQHAR